MNTDALLSALLKFQAWCVDNESLLRENSYLQERLANAHVALDDWKAVADKATDDLGAARRKLVQTEASLERARMEGPGYFLALCDAWRAAKTNEECAQLLRLYCTDGKAFWAKYGPRHLETI